MPGGYGTGGGAYDLTPEEVAALMERMSPRPAPAPLPEAPLPEDARAAQIRAAYKMVGQQPPVKRGLGYDAFAGVQPLQAPPPITTGDVTNAPPADPTERYRQIDRQRQTQIPGTPDHAPKLVKDTPLEWVDPQTTPARPDAPKPSHPAVPLKDHHTFIMMDGLGFGPKPDGSHSQEFVSYIEKRLGIDRADAEEIAAYMSRR